MPIGLRFQCIRNLERRLSLNRTYPNDLAVLLSWNRFALAPSEGGGKG